LRNSRLIKWRVFAVWGFVLLQFKCLSLSTLACACTNVFLNGPNYVRKCCFILDLINCELIARALCSSCLLACEQPSRSHRKTARAAQLVLIELLFVAEAARGGELALAMPTGIEANLRGSARRRRCCVGKLC
jgi:hypothetical protein